MTYEITSRPFTILVVHLEQGESFRSKPDTLGWMTPGIRMETKFDSVSTGLKKAVVGRAPIAQIFTAEQDGEVALSIKTPGDVILFDINTTPIIIQKHSYLASTEDVKLEVFHHQDIATGFFGGTGFVMEKYTERGFVWVGIRGSLKVRELAEGEKLVVSPYFVAAMETSCSMEVQWVRGASNVILGSEGLFHTVITGPGKVWMQTMPINSFASDVEQVASLLTMGK